MEIKAKPKNRSVELDNVAKLNLYASYVEDKWVKIRNKLEALKRVTKCYQLNKMPNPEGYKQGNCYFWSGKSKHICKGCDFYNKELIAFEESMVELEQALKDFYEAANSESRNA